MSENSNNKKTAISTSNHYASRQYYRDNLRVLRKNLLFCSGLPLSLTEDDIRSKFYFGKYGEVVKVIMLKNLRQMSVYVTYSDVYQASLAIIVIDKSQQKATNDFQFDRFHKLASIYGTIKYCKYFLKKIQCKNIPNCNYLHVYDKKNQILIDNQLPDQVFEEHYSIALRLLNQINPSKMIKQKKFKTNNLDDILPCPIQALNRISKIRLQGSTKYIEAASLSASSCSSQSDSQSNQKNSSEQDTSQTIVPDTLEATQIQKEEFPKITVLTEPLILKQKQKQKQKQQNNQSLQIKLIRKLVRQPYSKLNDWTDYDKEKQQIQQINLFHRQLSQLNELREICQSNILKEKNKEQQRLKFLLIKNIHHKKHHKQCHHHKNGKHCDAGLK